MQCSRLHLLGCIYLINVCFYHTDHRKVTSLSEASYGKLRAKQRRGSDKSFWVWWGTFKKIKRA